MEGFVSIFILADMDEKIKRIMQVRNMDEKKARAAIERHDKKRKAYHDYFCKSKWGESKTYDICINSSRLGIEATVEFLYEYIKKTLA